MLERTRRGDVRLERVEALRRHSNAVRGDTIKNPIPRSESSIQLTRLQLGVVARPCSSKPALVPVRVDRLAEVGIIFFIRQRLSKDSLLLI